MKAVVRRSSRFLQFLKERSRAFLPKRPVQKQLVLWVIACNRTGKTTLLKVLQKHPGSLIYNEGSALAYRDCRIRSPAEIARLIANTDRDLVVFELANDLQYADSCLNLAPHSKALWIYRDFQDVARDAVVKWGPAQRDIITGIGEGIPRHPGQQAIAEQMTTDTLSLVRDYSGRRLSADDGAALLWYTRNQLYFQLGLDKDPRVLLVKYEDLAAKPCEQLRRIFDFIERPFKTDYTSGITASYIGKTPLSGLNPEIRAICDGLMQHLTACCAMQRVTGPATAT